MTAKLVKLLKAVGSYSEAEISDAIHSTLDAASKNVLTDYVEEINNKLHGAPSFDVAKKESPKKKIDSNQKFILLVAKIRAQLRVYGASANEDSY